MFPVIFWPSILCDTEDRTRKNLVGETLFIDGTTLLSSPGRLFLDSEGRFTYSVVSLPTRSWSHRKGTLVRIGCRVDVEVLFGGRFGKSLRTRCLWHYIIYKQQNSVIQNPIKQCIVVYWLYSSEFFVHFWFVYKSFDRFYYYVIHL